MGVDGVWTRHGVRNVHKSQKNLRMGFFVGYAF